MWIAKIELLNFKSYQHQIFEFPQPSAGKNIVLIGGMNGYGKTSILEALYLGLYGKEAVEHLGRAGLKDDIGYRKFVERALHRTATHTKDESMRVSIQINQSKADGFEVTRKWFFNRSGGWTGEDEVVIYEVHDGNRGRMRDADRLPELLDQRFVPAHVAPFFFFDGEEVKKLADQSRGEQIRTGIEGLLGVVLLRKLKKRLEEFQANRSNGISVIDEKKLRQLFETLTHHEREYEDAKHKKHTLDESLERLQEQRRDLLNRTMQLGGGAGDVASVADLLKQQADAEAEIRSTDDALDDLVAHKLPFHLVARDLREELLKQVKEEIARDSWDSGKKSLEPGKAKFIETFYATTEPPLSPELTADQGAALQARLNAAWESLFYPMPKGCAAVVVHEYFDPTKRAALLQAMNGLRMGAHDVIGLVVKRESLEKRIRELTNLYTKIEGVDRDGSLAKLKEELDVVIKTLDQRQRELGDMERQMSGLKSTIDQDRAIYDREHGKFVQANPVKSMVGRANCVCKLINELIPQLYELKVNQLADAMTDVYKKFAHKKQVDRIDIDESGNTTILDKEGQVISFDRSAGENQVFATALLGGLADISGIDAPLVVDTPLGRLDSTHRANILQYWVSDTKRQVILLSQDKEIDRDTYLAMEPNVGKTFLLQHAEIGRTIAIPNEYFTELTQ